MLMLILGYGSLRFVEWFILPPVSIYGLLLPRHHAGRTIPSVNIEPGLMCRSVIEDDMEGCL